MPKRYKADEQVVKLLTLVISALAYAYFSRQGSILLYGDAVAHINIARRIVDSLTPGPLQIGTVWLPLPHLFVVPLVWKDSLWQSGIAGSIPSMLAFVGAAAGIFRLVSIVGSRLSAWLAAVVFIANPNLLYLQATAMTESIFLATMTWSCAYFVEFWVATRHGKLDVADRVLRGCGWALLAAAMTRYDGWFLAAITLLLVLGRYAFLKARVAAPIGRSVSIFVLLACIGPIAWLTYNFAIYGNAIEFANGPYSARAIMQKTENGFVHPGHRDLRKANSYFIKDAKLNLGNERWGEWMFRIALLASIIAVIDRRFRPALLLWSIWPFYVLSVAFGGVPIFFPEWSPHSYYNVRYGIELLPAAAVFFAIAYDMLRRMNWNRAYNLALPILFTALVVASSVSIWRDTPIVLREAIANSHTRLPYERALAFEIAKLPRDSRILMFTGVYSGALQQAAVPFRRVINEGNYRIWQNALESPAESADYIVATAGDPVSMAVASHGDGLESVAIVHGQERPPTVIYKSMVRAPK